MRTSSRALLGLLSVSMVIPAPASAAPGGPYVQGPDIEPFTMPVAVVDVITDARWECSETPAVEEFTVPRTRDGGPWDRIIVQVESIQTGDPWDRLLVAAVNGAEVLRATTPRTRMTLRKDITQFASLLPQGSLATASLSIGSYVGSIEGRLRLEFYDGESTAALVPAPAGRVLAPMLTRRINHKINVPPVVSAPVDFGAGPAPSRAIVDVFTSGHGAEEFWFQQGALFNVAEQRHRSRRFRVAVDGIEIGTFDAMPYVYALLGFGGPNANTACVGPGGAEHGDILHPLLWWTAQRELDRAGVHLNSGEIPQYRIEVTDPELLAAMTGNRTVTITVEGMPRGNDSGVWVTSLVLALD